MTVDVDDVIALLDAHADPRGMASWERQGLPGRTFGLGLTTVKRLAKGVPRDHALARALWAIDLYEAKIVAAQIGDPKRATREEVEADVEHARGYWMLSHVFCTGWLAKTPFAADLVDAWAEHDDPLRRRCAYLLLCQLAKARVRVDPWFLAYLDRIERSLRAEENFVRDAMNNALVYVGGRSAPCWRRALEIARTLGKVDVDYGDNTCKAIDAVKHLDTPRYKSAFGSA